MTSGSQGSSCAGSREKGYAYLMLLLGVAGITTIAGYSLELGATSHRREAERELLRVGAAYERALMAYAASGPPSDPMIAGPTSLNQLLKDQRQPQTLRHLRKLFKDPVSGENIWGTVRGPAGNILGVYSLAAGRPFQQKNFPEMLIHLENAETYADWVFGLPQARSVRSGKSPDASPNLRQLAPQTLPNNPLKGVTP